MSNLTNEINKFEGELASINGDQRSKEDNNIIKLTRLLLQLSQKVDKLDGVSE